MLHAPCAGPIEIVLAIQAELRQKSSQREQLVLAQRLFGLEAVSYPALAQVREVFTESILPARKISRNLAGTAFTHLQHQMLGRSTHIAHCCEIVRASDDEGVLPEQVGMNPAAHAQV